MLHFFLKWNDITCVKACTDRLQVQKYLLGSNYGTNKNVWCARTFKLLYSFINNTLVSCSFLPTARKLLFESVNGYYIKHNSLLNDSELFWGTSVREWACDVVEMSLPVSSDPHPCSYSFFTHCLTQTNLLLYWSSQQQQKKCSKISINFKKISINFADTAAILVQIIITAYWFP